MAWLIRRQCNPNIGWKDSRLKLRKDNNNNNRAQSVLKWTTRELMCKTFTFRLFGNDGCATVNTTLFVVYQWIIARTYTWNKAMVLFFFFSELDCLSSVCELCKANAANFWGEMSLFGRKKRTVWKRTMRRRLSIVLVAEFSYLLCHPRPLLRLSPLTLWPEIHRSFSTLNFCCWNFSRPALLSGWHPINTQ